MAAKTKKTNPGVAAHWAEYRAKKAAVAGAADPVDKLFTATSKELGEAAVAAVAGAEAPHVAAHAKLREGIVRPTGLDATQKASLADVMAILDFARPHVADLPAALLNAAIALLKEIT